MARNKKIEGRCRICGVYGPLSFEHVPPRAAFNDNKVRIVTDFYDAVSRLPGDITRWKTIQKGKGEYTLCQKCNNDTGSWYGSKFIGFCYDAMGVLMQVKNEPILYYPYSIYPLAIIKQIVSMFFSVNHEGFSDKNDYLVRFVLNKEMKYLPPEIRIYIYYNVEGVYRSTGIMGASSMGLQRPMIMSEISFPPFGYLMTLESEVPDARLVDISHFANYEYNEYKLLNIKLPLLPTYTMYAGDYRSLDEIRHQASLS